MSDYVVIGMIGAGVALVTLVLHLHVERNFFSGGSTSAQRKPLWVANILGGIWAVSHLSLSKAIRSSVITEPMMVALAAAVVALVGVAFVWGIYRWLLNSDELIRRIETEALALGLGLGVVGIVAARQLERAGVWGPASFEVDSSALVVFPALLGYGIARLYVYKRYR